LGLWVAALVCTCVALGTARAWRARTGVRAIPHRDVLRTDLGWYLILVGTFSVLVFWLVACSQIAIETFRYDLMAALLPCGALLVGVHRASRATTAGLVTAVLIWIGLGATDYLALAAEVRSGRWPDRRGEAITALEARGLVTLWGDFRLAHVLTFRSRERLVVAAMDRERIDEYAARARAAGGPTIRLGPCLGGEELVPTIYLCPGPTP
jgi:hypothetical protein